MKTLINISGSSRGELVTAYVDRKYVLNAIDARVDFDRLYADGYDRFIHMDAASDIKIKLGVSPIPKGSFLWVNITSPWTKYDHLLRSNIPIKVNYSFTILDWCVYGCRMIFNRTTKLIASFLANKEN